jgi:ketosteroid isomerase-like protein
MTDDETRALALDLYQAYRDGNAQRVADIIDDEIDWVIYGPVEVFPFEGSRKGKPAVLAVLAGIANEYKLERYQPEILIAENDRAAVLSDVTFEQRASGRKLRFRLVNFLRFRNGRLIEFREFADTFDVVEQALGQFIELPAARPA